MRLISCLNELRCSVMQERVVTRIALVLVRCILVCPRFFASRYPAGGFFLRGSRRVCLIVCMRDVNGGVRGCPDVHEGIPRDA